MANVSKNKLEGKTQQKLFAQFGSLFAQSDQKHISRLFEALFTDSEKIHVYETSCSDTDGI